VKIYLGPWVSRLNVTFLTRGRDGGAALKCCREYFGEAGSETNEYRVYFVKSVGNLVCGY